MAAAAAAAAAGGRRKEVTVCFVCVCVLFPVPAAAVSSFKTQNFGEIKGGRQSSPTLIFFSAPNAPKTNRRAIMEAPPHHFGARVPSTGHFFGAPMCFWRAKKFLKKGSTAAPF